MPKRNKLLFVLLLVFTFISFFLGGRLGIDPDFGWHIRVGELILSHGIPHTDPFSYTMPSYPYVDHEWLQNVIWARIYPFLGMEGLGLLYSSLAFLAIAIMAVPVKSRWVYLPFLLTGQSLLYFLGIRPQIVSWIFFALLIWVLVKDALWEKYKYWLPIFFILWANLHGSFPLGIVLLLITIGTHMITAKKYIWREVIIFILCIAATFLTPYGIGTWWEVWMTMTDSMLKWKIVEWSPTFFAPIYGMIILLPISVILVWQHRKKFTVLELVLYAWLLLIGVSTTRHAPFWLLFSIPMTARAIGYFYEDIKKDPISRQRLTLVHKWLVGGVFILISALLIFNVFRNTGSQTDSYPTEAITYIKAHPPEGNIFAEYAWGGYMVWQLPERKVFIDGRMPSWRRDVAPKGESAYAFNDQLTILRGDPGTEQMLTKYHITMILMASTDNTPLVELVERYVPFKLPIPKRHRLQEKLKKLHFQQVYRDDTVILYVQKKH